jgi:hypothetical protein
MCKSRKRLPRVLTAVPAEEEGFSSSYISYKLVYDAAAGPRNQEEFWFTSECHEIRKGFSLKALYRSPRGNDTVE